MNRYLHFDNNINKQVKAERIHHHVRLKHKAHIYLTKAGKEEFLNLNFAAVTVALPEEPSNRYTLVIIKGFGKQPMLLLTNKQLNTRNSKDLWRIVEIYLTWWNCDECYRYIKQSYKLEDFRVMSYNSIRNIVAFVHAITYFTSIYLGFSLKLDVMVQKIFILSKSLFGVPTFFNYAMTDGIFELLKTSGIGIINFKGRTGIKYDGFQLSLFPD